MKKILDYIQNHYLFTIFTLLGLIVLAGHLINPTNIIFHESDVNPFLITAFIISAYYGFRVSLVIGPIYAAVYTLILYKQTDFTNIETINTLHHLSVPISLILFSPIVGQIKQFSLNRIKELENKLQENHRLNKNLKSSHELQEREIQDLKKKLVSKLDTVNSLYDDSKLFSTLNEAELLHNYIETLKNVTHLESATLYKKDIKGHFQIYSQLGNVPKIENNLIDAQNIVKKSINRKKLTTILDLDQSEMKREKLILISRPISTVNDEIQFLLVVYEMSFINFTHTNFKLIDIYSEWLSNSLNIIYKTQNAFDSEILDQSWGTYTKSYIERIIPEVFKMSNRMNVPIEILKIKVKSKMESNKSKWFIYSKCINEFILKINPYPHFCFKVPDSNIWYIFKWGNELSTENDIKNFAEKLKLPEDEKIEIDASRIQMIEGQLQKEGFNIV